MSPKIVIIGGGVIGASIAYHLSLRKACVTLIEKKDLASGSSGACDGLVFLQSKKPGIHLALAMESLSLYKQLQRQLPIDIEFKQTGGMVLIETTSEYEAMQAFAREQQKMGLKIALLDKARTLEKEPFLSDHIKGATFSALDGQVNPIALTLGFALAAEKYGAKILTHTHVQSIKTKGKRVDAVETTRGRLEADIIVNAAGCRAAEIAAMAGISIPIRPRKGQIVVTQATGPLLSHCMISAKYIAAKYDPSLADQSGEGISMEQTKNGNLLLGSTREFTGFDTQNTLEGIQKIIQQTANLLPALKNLDLIRCFAGLRPYTSDGMPLLGPVEGLEGFVMAAGHEGDGIALSPITGKLIAQMIMDGKTDFPLDAFSPGRFSKMEDKDHK